MLAALLWLGGLLFLGLVGAPVLRELDQSLRARLFHALGIRFRTIGWIAITVLVATGIELVRRLGVFAAPLGFWSTAFGRALLWKWGIVAAMLALAAAHDFYFGPRARSSDRSRRIASVLGRLNAALAVALVYAAVLVAHRGG